MRRSFLISATQSRGIALPASVLLGVAPGASVAVRLGLPVRSVWCGRQQRIRNRSVFSLRRRSGVVLFRSNSSSGLRWCGCALPISPAA